MLAPLNKESSSPHINGEEWYGSNIKYVTVLESFWYHW